MFDQDHEEHDLDDRAECRFKDHAVHLGQLSCQLLTSKADQVGGRYHADVCGDESPELDRIVRVPEFEVQDHNSDCERLEDTGVPTCRA
jgi:hypothetical protein